MSTLADVFGVLNRMRAAEVIADYAIGGATAVLFYAEPTRTYDLDVFVLTGSGSPADLEPLSRIYRWATEHGFSFEAEHVMIFGVPVQFLPAYNALVEAAVREAHNLDYSSVPVRVVGPEHLIALALQAGGARRRERAWQLLEAGAVDRTALRQLLEQHNIPAEIPDDV